jgi:hypothetical protein
MFCYFSIALAGGSGKQHLLNPSGPHLDPSGQLGAGDISSSVMSTILLWVLDDPFVLCYLELSIFYKYSIVYH